MTQSPSLRVLTEQGAADHATDPAKPLGAALKNMFSLKAETAPLSFFGGMYNRLNGGLTIGFGDSLTSPGAHQRSHFEQLAVRSGQRVARLHNAGVPQDTTQLMLARLQADVLDKRPERVVFMAGTNNIGQDQAAGQAAYREILDRLTIAGIAVALISIPPRTTATQLHKDQTVAWNVFVKAEAARRGMPYVDIYSALVDPATGGFKPEYTSDNLHMSALGASVSAKIEWEALSKVWPELSPVYLTSSPTDPTNLFANGTLVDADANGIPDGYAVTNAPTRATVSVIDATGITGKAVRITRLEADTGTFFMSRTITAGFAADDVMEMAVKFRPAAGNSPTYSVYANVSDVNNAMILQPYPISAWTIDLEGGWGVAYHRFTVPVGATRIQMYVGANSGLGTVDFAQFTLRNRTALATTPPGADPAAPAFPVWGTYPAVTMMASNSDASSLLTNPLLSDADANGVPDSWTQTVAPSRAVVSVGTDPSVTGNYMRITRAEAATGSFSVNQHATAGVWAVGDTLEAAVKFRSPSNAVTANFYVLCADVNGATTLNKQILANWANQTDGFKTAAATFAVPAGTTRVTFYMHTSSGVGHVDFAQATLRKVPA